MKKSNTSERLRFLMEERNLKQVDILNKAKNVGGYLSKSALSQYVSGKSEPDQEKLTLLSEILGVSETWLMGYDTNIDGIKNIFKPTTNKAYPLVGTIAAGVPILAEENIDEYVNLDRKINADFCLRVAGDSMVLAHIFDGDIVFIRKQPDVENGEIAAVLIDERATLKKVHKYSDRIELRAENPRFKTIELDDSSAVSILGKAVYKLSKI